MTVSYVSPLVIERGYSWQVNMDVYTTAGSAFDLSTYTGYMTASALLISATASGQRLTFARTTAQTSAYNFDRIGYEVWITKGVTAEKIACGELVLSTGIGR